MLTRSITITETVGTKTRVLDVRVNWGTWSAVPPRAQVVLPVQLRWHNPENAVQPVLEWSTPLKLSTLHLKVKVFVQFSGIRTTKPSTVESSIFKDRVNISWHVIAARVIPRFPFESPMTLETQWHSLGFEPWQSDLERPRFRSCRGWG